MTPAPDSFGERFQGLMMCAVFKDSFLRLGCRGFVALYFDIRTLR